jgi:hypothetical protein
MSTAIAVATISGGFSLLRSGRDWFSRKVFILNWLMAPIRVRAGLADSRVSAVPRLTSDSTLTPSAVEEVKGAEALGTPVIQPFPFGDPPG